MNSYYIGLYFGYLASASAIIPLFYFLRKKDKRRNLILISLASLLTLGCITDLISILFSSIWSRSNYFILNTEFIIEILLIHFLFLLICPPIKKFLVTGAFILIIVFILCCFLFQSINTYQSIVKIIATFLIMGYSYLYYRNLLSELPTENPMKYSPFLIILGLFTYFAMNLYIYALSTYVFTQMSKQDAVIFWMFHGASEISKNILFAMAFYYAGESLGLAREINKGKFKM